jgi:hypothetical protein
MPPMRGSTSPEPTEGPVDASGISSSSAPKCVECGFDIVPGDHSQTDCDANQRAARRPTGRDDRLALAGAMFLIEKLVETLRLGDISDVGELIDKVRRLVEYRDVADDERAKARALLDLHPATEPVPFLEVMEGRVQFIRGGRLAAQRQDLCEALDLPQDTTWDLVVAQAAALRTMARDAWSSLGVSAPTTVAELRERVEQAASQPRQVTLPATYSEEDVQEFAKAFDSAMIKPYRLEHLSSGEPSSAPQGPVREIVRFGQGYSVFDTETHQHLLYCQTPDAVIDYLLRFTEGHSHDWLRETVEGALLRGEAWPLFQVVGERDWLSRWRDTAAQRSTPVVTRIQFTESINDVTPTPPQVTVEHEISSSDRASAQEEVSVDKGSNEKVSAAVSSKDELSRSEASSSGNRRSAIRSSVVTSDDPGPHVTQQLYAETDSCGSRYGIYDVRQRQTVLKDATSKDVIDHFLRLVTPDGKEAMTRRLNQAFYRSLRRATHVLFPLDEDVARAMTEASPEAPPAGAVLLTVDLTAPERWEEPVELPDHTPNITFRTLFVNTKESVITDLFPDGKQQGSAVFEVTDNASGVGYTIRDLLRPEAKPAGRMGLFRVAEYLLDTVKSDSDSNGFSIAVQADLVITLMRESTAYSRSALRRPSVDKIDEIW